MSKKIFVTVFIFVICSCVFLFINAQPVSVSTRLNGTAYADDTEIETDIRISFTGDLYEDLFKATKFKGTITITSEHFPLTQEDVTFRFHKDGNAQYTLQENNKEYGFLTVSENFKSLSVTITDADSENDRTVYLAAPATEIEQAKGIVKQLR